MRRKGLSLLETIFCCALLGIFLSVVSQLVVSAYRTQALYRDRLERQRTATVFLQKLVRTLQSATDVRLVSTLEAPTALTDLTGDGLLVTHATAAGLRTDHYFREALSHNVASEKYGPSFNYQAVASWTNLPGFPKVELRQTAGLSIEPITLGTLHMWRLKLSLDGLPQPYVRQVRCQPTEGL